MATCPDCEKPLEYEDAAFCTECGAKLALPAPPPEPGPEVEPAAEEVAGDVADEVGSAGGDVVDAGGVGMGLEDVDVVGDASAAPPEAVGFGDLAEPDPTVAEDDALPLALEFNQSVFLIDGCAGVMECRVRVLGDEPIEEVGVSLVSDVLGEASGATVPKLSPGRERVVGLPITPGAVGTHHLTATVVYEHGGQVYSAVAFHRVTVLEQNASPASIQIHYDNTVNASDNAVVSNKGGNLTGLDQLIASGQASVNDVLSQQATLAPSWLALELELDEAQTRELQRRRRDIVRPAWYHDPTARPTDRFALWSTVLGGASAAPVLGAQVLASPSITMGRAQQTADVVLRVLPRSEQNDEGSKMISGSRPHLQLRFEPQGPVLDDPGSANGTWVAGQRLEAPFPVDVHGPTRIDVAHVLSLQLTPVAGEPEPERYERLGGQDALWHWGASNGIASYRLEFVEPRGSQVARPPVVVPVRWVDLVEDAHAGLVVAMHPGRAPAVRVVRTRDGLWAEACIAGITLNQEPLPRGSAAPLSAGDTLASGGYAAKIDTFTQWVG